MRTAKTIRRFFHRLWRKVFTLVYQRYLSLRFGLIVRKRTSDRAVFQQIFFYKECDVPISEEPKLIIDLGAYVGYSTLWFARRFPNSIVIAVEPEPANYEALVHNTKRLKNVRTFQSAVWGHPARLRIRDPGFGTWGFSVEEVSENTPGAFQAMTIEELLERSGYNRIDILKIDIEGNEREIFSSETAGRWLDKVGTLIVELHDHIRPGCSEAFSKVITERDFCFSRKGERVVASRL